MKLFNKKNKLFPAIEPFDNGYLKRGVHEIYYEQCGNPEGKPIVFYMEVQEEELVAFQEGSSTLRNIVLFSLIKEVVVRANLILV